jgi:Leucine-rich repeat (LRR) protein
VYELFESLPLSIGDCQELRCMQLYFCAYLREIPNSICKLENLMVLHITASQALQQLPSKPISELRNLWTLNLSGCSHLKDLPSIFACCRLRNLVLSNTNITVLPQWVTSICTLECIELEYCTELVELPTGMGNLVNLEVLNIQGCWRLCCMPYGLRHLIRLRVLGLFVVGCGAKFARILELENLDMLSGQLEITNLRYLNDPGEALKACLKQKKKIDCLKLTWWSSSGIQEELVPGVEQDLGVLDALEPPPEITMLEISGYPGPHLPWWMRKQCESSCLKGIVLRTEYPRFHGLTQLVLEQLPNLKRMRGLAEFPSLKTFNLHGMPNLEELWTTTNGLEIGEENSSFHHCFPALSALFIWNCPKLNVRPYFPLSLEWLRLRKSNGQLMSPNGSSSRLLHPHVDESPFSIGTLAGVHLKKLKLEEMTASSSSWELLQQLTTLESLEIRLCNDLRELPASMRSLISLQRLHVDGCSNLVMLPEWLGELCSLQELSVVRTPMIDSIPESTEHLRSLVEMKIVGWGNLRQLPVAMKHLTSLQVLSLEGCSALCMLPDWIGQLSALRLLRIDRCSNLQSLPHSIKCLTALRSLSITGCPDLARRYKKEVGDEWHLVSHIPHVMCY